MKRAISTISKKSTKKSYDIIIIGGGITGACLAWDAITRGLSVALIEKADFGSATSSSLSGLLHGGIRYLQQGRIDKVRESALERIYFQKLAPHLSNYIPFVVPSYRSLMKSKWVLAIGMFLYQLICIGQNNKLKDNHKKVPGWKMLSTAQINAHITGIDLKGITGGALFYESHMQSTERMTLAFIHGAVSKGADVANYARVEAFINENNAIKGVHVLDLQGKGSHDIYASCVINAAGPWIPLLNRDISTTAVVTAFSKGAHIVTTQVTADTAIALTTQKQNQSLINRGGRHVFIIPWRGHSLIGTTYDAYSDDLDSLRPTERDIQELISDINSAAGKTLLTRNQVKYAFAGIYPLIDDKINAKIYQGTGEYQIIDHAASENMQGLYTVFGAKFTTARLLAEKAIDKIQGKFRHSTQVCKTRVDALPCGDIHDIVKFRDEMTRRYSNLVDKYTIDHLVTFYGNDIDKVMAYIPKDAKWRLQLSTHHPAIAAQIIYAVEHEMAYHLEDVIFRRTGLGTLGPPGDDTISHCADIMSECLLWPEATRQAEIERVQAYYHYDE